MRTQENKEKYKEYDHKYYIKNKRPKTKIGQAEAEINQLEQQLAEKDTRIEELEGQFAYECECNKQLVDLQKQLEEKQKLKTDRDTWKRACELACEREDDCYVYDNIHRAYEFYQQAKKEGEK